jgi:hypothetical protein
LGRRSFRAAIWSNASVIGNQLPLPIVGKFHSGFSRPKHVFRANTELIDKARHGSVVRLKRAGLQNVRHRDAIPY